MLSANPKNVIIYPKWGRKVSGKVTDELRLTEISRYWNSND